MSQNGVVENYVFDPKILGEKDPKITVGLVSDYSFTERRDRRQRHLNFTCVKPYNHVHRITVRSIVKHPFVLSVMSLMDK